MTAHLRAIFFFCLLCSSMVNVDAQQDTATIRTFGGANHEEGRQVIECALGGFAVIGTTGSDQANATNFYLLRLDDQLNCLWSKTLGGSAVDRGYGLVEDLEGNLILCGYSNDPTSGSYDVQVMKTDASGTLLWQKTYGGSDWDFGYKIVLHPDGGYAICGKTYSIGNGGSDGYVLHISNDGELLSEMAFATPLDEDFTDIDVMHYQGTDYLVFTGTVDGVEGITHSKGWVATYNLSTSEMLNYFVEHEGENVRLNSSFVQDSTILYCGYRTATSVTTGLYGKLDEALAPLTYLDFPVSGNYNYYDVAMVGDMVAAFGEEDYVGSGGKDAVVYFWQNNGFFGAPTFGSNLTDMFYSGIIASDGSVVAVGHTGRLNVSSPQLLAVRLSSIIGSTYTQVYHLDDDCFELGVVENLQESKGHIVAEQYYDAMGRMLWQTDDMKAKIPAGVLNGFVIVRQQFSDGHAEVVKRFY
jgi:hypothetical protein